MQTILTVFFSMLAGGAVFWLVLELRERQASRRILRQAADEAAAEEGMRRLRERPRYVADDDDSVPGVPWPHNMRDPE